MQGEELLRLYAEHGDESAFNRLVSRYLGLVYSTCLREVEHPELAQDVTQAVFLILSRKARSLRSGTALAGWLYTTARFAARNALRQEQRRRAREERAADIMATNRVESEEALWNERQPLLYDALATLGRRDREAILLRFFEDRSLKEIGQALGVSADAAQMRISRALARLRNHFAKQGIALSATALTSLLAAEDARAAPNELAEAASRSLQVDGTQAALFLFSSPRVHQLTEGVIQAMNILRFQKILLLVVVLATLGSGFVVTARSLQAGSPDGKAPTTLAIQAPTAEELLRRFAETQAKLQSFIVKTETTTRTIEPVAATRMGQGEWRADPKTGRFAARFSYWGDTSSGEQKSKQQPGYTSHMWDGKQFYTYSHSNVGFQDILTLDPTSTANQGGYLRQLRTGYAGAACMGYFRFDEERIDTLLKGAKSLRIRPKTERIQGEDCYVLEGVTKSGKYTLWLSPQQGYNIARAEALKTEGDIVLGRPLKKGAKVQHVLQNVRFEQVAGVWMPMEADEELGENFPGSEMEPTTWQTHHKKTSVVLNPDFAALNAFKPDDIREGTKVYIIGKSGAQYVWKKGRMEPYSDDKLPPR